MKICLVTKIFVCLLLCGVRIAAQTRDQKSSDGPVSVNLGDVFEKGKIKIDTADLSKLPALPRGYSAIPSMAYRITTDAVAAGPYTVVFGVSSVTDEETFKKLRVFHAEPDEFDPDSPVWVDRTARGPDTPAPDFSRKTIAAYSDELETGIYVIGKLTEEITPSTAVADVEVVALPAPEVVQMPANITLSMIVKNHGPQTATDVGLKQEFPRGTMISMKASQGNCKWKPGWVYCKVGQLLAGGSAKVSLVIDPGPDFAGQYFGSVEVAGKESDSNPANNRGVTTADTLGDPNHPPDVTLESPEMEQVFELGATVAFKASASDRDGSISKVEFLDNDQTLGVATTTDAKHFSLNTNQLANGFHVLNAMATDNGGRQTISNAQQIFVNGPIKIKILTPKTVSALTAGSDLVLTAIATNPLGSIKKVEFFYNGGFPLGEATAVGDNRYTIKLPALVKANYSIEALATDSAGLVSKSEVLRFNVMK